MSNKIRSWFREHGIAGRQIANATGYSLMYVYGLLCGSEKLTDAAKFRLMQAFPGLQEIIMDAAYVTPAAAFEVAFCDKATPAAEPDKDKAA